MRRVLLATTVLCAASAAHAQNLAVSASGFTENGQPVSLRGVDALVPDALAGFANVTADFPGMTMLRLDAQPGTDSAASIAQAVQEYTSKGIVVELEQHSWTGGGADVAWYSQMASEFKNNPLVLLETTNEPSGSASSVAQQEVAEIQAIRAAGFTNPIGVQPVGGYDQSNIPLVTAAVGTAGLYVTPHIYYGGTDPNGAAQYVASEIQTAQASGLFPVIDEFGDATNGYTPDPQGQSTISAVIAANQAGQAGASFWDMSNGNQPDSVCMTQSCSALTSDGQELQGWLSGSNPSATSVPIATAAVTSAPSDPPPATTSVPATTRSTASPSDVTPGNGQVTDCSGNTWAINSDNRITENGMLVPGGGDTSALTVQNCTVFGLSNGLNGSTVGWFTVSSVNLGGGQYWTASAAPTGMAGSAALGLAPQVSEPSGRAPQALGGVSTNETPPPIVVQQCAATPTGSGGFHVAGGQIIGPDSKPWTARGINVYSDSAGASNPAAITSTFTGLNFVRYIVRSLNDPSTYDAFVNAMSSQGRVTEFENHPDGGGGQDTSPPQGIAAESAWYAAMAERYKSNPYVWFGTFNEPGINFANPGQLSAWQQATYNAVRSASQTILMVEDSGVLSALVPSVYAGMHNIVWDQHWYHNASTTAITAAIAADQGITSADGVVPVIIGELGPSEDGTNLDADGYDTVTALITVAQGGTMGGLAPFTYYPGFDSPNDLTDSSGNVTSPYGQMAQIYINTDVVPPTQCQQAAAAQTAINAAAASLASAPQ